MEELRWQPTRFLSSLSWKHGIGIFCLLAYSFFAVKYLRVFAPFSSVETLPQGQNIIVFYGDIFTSPLTKMSGLFVLDVETESLTHWDLPMDDSGYSYISWSPQTQQLLFNGFIEQNYGFYLIDREGNTNKINISFPRTSFDHTVSPDGEYIAFIQDEELYVQNLEGGEPQQLTDNDRIDREPNWSPDGRQIVFRTYFQDEELSAIVRINKDGTGLETLTTTPNVPSDLRWSPDGSMIAFTQTDSRLLYGLWVMKADGSEVRQILGHISDTDSVFDLVWSPDSKYIAFASSRDGFCGMQIEYQPTCTWSLYLIDVNISYLRGLTYKWIGYANLAWPY